MYVVAVLAYDSRVEPSGLSDGSARKRRVGLVDGSMVEVAGLVDVSAASKRVGLVDIAGVVPACLGDAGGR